MQRVFLTENDFLATPPAVRLNRHGYRVQVGDQTYFVWATRREEAMGIVAQHVNLMTITSYTTKEVKQHEAVEIDPQLIETVAALTEPQQMKLRNLIV